jgi:hypothetical protein
MKVTRVNFRTAVNVAGKVETLIYPGSEMSRLVESSLDMNLRMVKLSHKTTDEVVFVPMENVNYLQLDLSDAKTTETSISGASVNGKKK